MSALSNEHLTLLICNLESDYVAHLPALLPNTKPHSEQVTKNRSRAFSAFALRHHLGISEKDAAEAVIDDFDDVGIDAIYFHGASQTLYFVQTKLQKGAEFKQDEALAFCQGVRKCLVQDFAGFNGHFIRRQGEIESALDDCNTIQLVVVHIGAGMSYHASSALVDLINDDTHGDQRLAATVLEFDASRIVPALQASKANRRVDVEKLTIHKWATVSEPRTTYFGYVRVSDLVTLYAKEKSALFDKNIRLFLGPKSEVSQSIQKTLAEKPEHFFYLNNGVTVLCERIDSKSNGGGKRLKIVGFSVINGAQTISSAAQFVADNPCADISAARVTITLIQADADGSFGKSVTRARNHQNKVESADFLALDDEQERLRRELALLGIHYSYKAEQIDGVVSDTKIKAPEATGELSELLPSSPVFATPKPERLMQRILQIATNPGDLVLDSFLGSGTTAAVAHKMGRRWIGIELGEHCHTHCLPRLKKVVDGADPGGITEAVGWKGGGGFRYYRLAPSLLTQDKWGNWVISKEYNAPMLAEAVCKLEGFTYAPSETVYWQHGHSTERDFLYVTTASLNHDQLQQLSDEVGPDRSLLVICSAFRSRKDCFPNLTIKKIPHAVLSRCEWGHDDYSLKVENLPKAPPPPPMADRNGQQSLFGEEVGK